MSEVIYKICPRDLWRQAERTGRFDGAPVDREDGYIHFSTASQLAETARRHFAGEEDLLLVAVRTEGLGDGLRYEPSRNGEHFPHLYGAFGMADVAWVAVLNRRSDGELEFPELAQ